MTAYTDQEYIRHILFRRKPDAHKGDFGKILIFAGSVGMAGAAILCGRAALKSGAGLVQYLLPGFDSPLLPILQISVPEATCVSAENSEPLSCLDSYTAIACGSGLGKSETSRRILTRILETYEGTLLLDADALNMIAESKELTQMTRSCRASVIITPHIGEARRLLHTDAPIADPESRRSAVCRLAREYDCIAILKGAGTLVAQQTEEPSGEDPDSPSFRIFRNTTGNPGMATAGSGDSLAGLITSLAAQGYAPLDAARTGVYMHGKAGDLAAADLGEMGMTASDIVNFIPLALKTSGE